MSPVILPENPQPEPAENSGGNILQPLAQTAGPSTGGKPPSRDETRKAIAIIYVCVFLAIVTLTLIFMLWECYSINDIKDILLTESGILSGPLGFIIGFYFKEELDKKT